MIQAVATAFHLEMKRSEHETESEEWAGIDRAQQLHIEFAPIPYRWSDHELQSHIDTLPIV